MMEDWVECEFGDLLSYEQPTNYIVKSTSYDESYKTPVLTAGKSFIKGYTNEEDGIFVNIPTIIFDDFTTASKFVDFKFKVKSSAMKILIPRSSLTNMKFVFYAMKVNRVRSDTHKRYWISVFAKKKFLLPPLPIQRAIVSKIETLFSSLDRGIADLKKAQDQLKVYRQAVLSMCLKSKQSISIGEVLNNLNQGWSPKCINESSKNIEEWAVIKTSSIQAYQFLENENKILPKSLDPKEQHELKNGDVLITRAGPRVRVGVACLVKSVRPKLINCDKVYRLEVNSDMIRPDYLVYALNSPEVLDKIERMKSGSNDSGLNLTQKVFKKLLIPSIRIEDQDERVKKIETIFSVCNKIEEGIEDGLRKAEALRQSILKRAFEGKLLTVDEIEECKAEVDYEPASMLVARIKTDYN